MQEIKPIPAPGYKRISGRRNPPRGDGDKRYFVQYRNGIIDERYTLPARTERGLQTQWKWPQDSDWAFDIVAVKEV